MASGNLQAYVKGLRVSSCYGFRDPTTRGVLGGLGCWACFVTSISEHGSCDIGSQGAHTDKCLSLDPAFLERWCRKTQLTQLSPSVYLCLAPLQACPVHGRHNILCDADTLGICACRAEEVCCGVPCSSPLWLPRDDFPEGTVGSCVTTGCGTPASEIFCVGSGFF